MDKIFDWQTLGGVEVLHESEIDTAVLTKTIGLWGTPNES